ncbi:MAG: hypothetical protein E7351_01140 [Clostridiales bacterium]|nr:hypothetical protein [Clostridiales bacterium]
MDFEDIQIRVEKPYPEIEGAREDMTTVSILKNLANSRSGELNAVLQYVYQSCVSDKTMQDIADIFEEIGIVEMMHLHILMHAIGEFGGIPKYEDSHGVGYNTGNVNYTTKLKDMLDNNIRAETFAIEQYNLAINRVKNDSLKRLFARIIEDEERHLEIFKTLKNRVHFFSI